MVTGGAGRGPSHGESWSSSVENTVVVSEMTLLGPKSSFVEENSPFVTMS